MTKRAYALDALRGYAIITMVLSATVAWNSLPGWMYHAQTPPPDRAFDASLSGIWFFHSSCLQWEQLSLSQSKKDLRKGTLS
mgnify:CR=1 FL=1